MKVVQLVPLQRSTRYWLIVPPVSVPAVQLKLICVLENTVAPKFDGAVKIGAGVVAPAVFEYGPRLLAASVARTR